MENNSRFHPRVLNHLKVMSNRNLFLILLIMKESLSSRQLQIVLLRYQGYKLKEIAEKLSLSPSMISVECKRIKAIMREALKYEL